jgi:hypothetical protein
VFALVLGLTAACTSPSADFSGTVQSDGTNFHSTTASKAGTATVTLTWNDNTVDLDLYVTAAACNATDPIISTDPNCSLLAISDDVGTKQEQVTLAVTKDQALKLWVDNFTSKAQAYNLKMEIK